MENFQFQNPTKLIFGKGQIAKLAKEIPLDKKILLTFGGGSVKQNGVYDQVEEALKNHNCVEFWGIEPNPTVETLRKAIALGKENQIDFLLAIGGGSVLDGTKLISAGILNENEAWDIVRNPKLLGACLPYGSVLTLPATGSEMNRGAVISNMATHEKFAFYSTYPTFSILDPETTFSLPEFQVAVGIADTFVHVMEQYLTTPNQSPLMDRWAEGILQTLVEISPKIRKNQHDYEQMSNFMLCATMALNGFISMGVSQDWATHMIGHEISALHNTTHGQSLVIVFPALMRVMAKQKQEKILQYGARVWNITTGSTEEKIQKTIAQTETFFRSLGLVTKLSELNIGQDTIDEIVSRFKARGTMLGENQNVSADVVKEILELAK
ncbi:MAG: iron-containing alcohol dehydrogenase [Bacteroidales bacterium]|jgi:NADP-dependent alcohol dehydrogenase|nr:iron-containing alcohol dehydrogenase [Bacteroidales bacterium]